MRVFSYFWEVTFFGAEKTVFHEGVFLFFGAHFFWLKRPSFTMVFWYFPIFWVCLFLDSHFLYNFILVIAFAFVFVLFVCMYILFNENANGF